MCQPTTVSPLRGQTCQRLLASITKNKEFKNVYQEDILRTNNKTNKGEVAVKALPKTSTLKRRIKFRSGKVGTDSMYYYPFFACLENDEDIDTAIQNLEKKIATRRDLANLDNEMKQTEENEGDVRGKGTISFKLPSERKPPQEKIDLKGKGEICFLLPKGQPRSLAPLTRSQNIIFLRDGHMLRDPLFYYPKRNHHVDDVMVLGRGTISFLLPEGKNNASYLKKKGDTIYLRDGGVMRDPLFYHPPTKQSAEDTKVPEQGKIRLAEKQLESLNHSSKIPLYGSFSKSVQRQESFSK